MSGASFPTLVVADEMVDEKLPLPLLAGSIRSSSQYSSGLSGYTIGTRVNPNEIELRRRWRADGDTVLSCTDCAWAFFR